MPYTRPYPGGFQDFPNTTTPINASTLNTMDVGIKTANDQFQTVTTAQRATLTPTVGQAVWDSDLKQVMVYMNASGGNAWQPVGNRIVCASTTRPSSPFEGQEIYETDTQKTLVYSGSAWVETNDLDYSPSATVCTSSTRPTTGLFEGQRIYETDTNKEFTYSGAAWVQTNQWSTTSGVTGVSNLIVPPACRLYNTAAINPYTSGAVITWNAEEYDTDGMHSTVSNTSRVTIQTAGVYSIVFLLRGSWSGTMTSQGITILVNGAEHSVHEVFGISTTIGGSWMTVSAIDDFAVNDYIEVRWGLGGATSPQVLTPSRLAVSWIGQIT